MERQAPPEYPEYENYDDEIIDEDAKKEEEATKVACSKSGDCRQLPKTQLLKLQILYNTPLLTKMGSEDAVSKLINSVMTHVQAYYCHASLGSKLKLQQTGVKYYKEPGWEASGKTLNRLTEIMNDDFANSEARLFVGLTYDDEKHGKNNWAGLACIWAACNVRAWENSISEWSADLTNFANTVAHEIGHNLGMDHDFDKSHKGKGCDKQGIMSYDGTWNKWSKCSREDFTNHYRTVLKKKGKWCLDEAPSACA